MRNQFKNGKIKFYIGDVRSYQSIFSALKGVDYVFHAAALKQVPSCEFYPMEAVQTNILGAENVLNASIAHEVKKVIFLSTDKAVYPINAMGMTKALMERLMVAKSRLVDPEKTTLCCTRYGNVMCSRGSVIPLFVKLLKEKKSLTVTDPNMTRFLMSLDEAVDLVLYAYEHGRQGDIFVRKAPASTIGDLAAALLELFHSLSEVKIIGTRHGEKLHETLLSREEIARAEETGDYFRIAADNRDLNYNKYFVEGEEIVSALTDYSSHNTYRLSVPEIIGRLTGLDFIRRELQGGA